MKEYFKKQNIEFSFNRIGIQALGGMAHGLFASLLIGTVIKTVSVFLPAETSAIGAFCLEVSKYTGAVQGAAMAIAIGYAVKADPFVLYSLATVGYATNSLGGAGGPLAVYVVSLFAIFFGKLVSKRTPIDLLVTPIVTICSGVLIARLIAPMIGAGASALGGIIMWATGQAPFIMGILVSAFVGIVLTLPISSAAICAALGLIGYAGGAATAGCCAHMVGFAICAYFDNKAEGLASVGLGTSMLLVPNLLKKPVLWLPAVLTSAITGPIATCVFKMTQNGAAVSSGMGTCGLVGPIGVVTGWLSPADSAKILEKFPDMDPAQFAAISPTATNWIGMLLVCIILPAVLGFVFYKLFKKVGLIKEGDYKLLK